MENKAPHEPSKLPYQLIKQLTNDLHKKRFLGSGTFGKVYKGVRENGEEIAVKVLHNISGLDDKAFHKEFNNLRGLKHPNIVEFVGFCSESEEELVPFEGKIVTAERLHMALCFEYVHNGSLHKHISDENTGFTWHTRYKIIKGICEGLKYLREGLEYPVMHFDLKPDNILLDKCMVPKIADFGTSKLFGEENTRKTLSSVGTIGYCPPEYLKHQIISKEFDIFSLGVIIVRIMIGHGSYNSVVEMPTRKSVKLVHESWRKRLRGTMSHTSLEVYCNQVKRCIEIALSCLISNRQERPTIQDIVSSLNETETMIGDRGIKNEQFYQDDGEPTLPSSGSSIIIKSMPSSDNSRAVEPTVMPFSLLKEITDNFSHERIICRDGYGNFYKGIHGDGQVVAIKSHTYVGGFDHTHFENEIAILTKLRHQNIVQLIGYCNETEEMVVEYKEGKYVIVETMHHLLCFEYSTSGNLAGHISDMACRLDWWTQYRIIKGMCEGLKYLQEGWKIPILHLDIKPENIWLDEKMTPKIGCFSLARQLHSGRSCFFTSKMAGTIGYMPPEFIQKQVITKEFDIYSLGVTTIRLIVGRESYYKMDEIPTHEFIELEHQKWRRRLEKIVNARSVEGYCQQVKKCLEIAVQCVELDRHKRPTIGDIVHMLNETEILVQQSDFGPDLEQLLEVHPLELEFMSPASLFEVAIKKKAAIMSSSHSLQLKNKEKDRVAFMLVANNLKRYLKKEPLCGVVPPRCSYTLTLRMRNNKRHPPSSSLDSGGCHVLTLYSVGLSEYDLLKVDKDSVSETYENFFKTTKEEVQEVTLKVICDRPAVDQGTSSSEIVTTADAQQVSSIDVHPTEPWIMTANDAGSLRIWNYKTMETLKSFELAACEPVHVAKFIPREKWLIAGDRDGGILVYSYENEDAKSFYAHENCITTLAVHPTSPFVLSSSEDDDHLIKLWDWGKGWKCTREFGGHTGRVTQVTFNPENSDTFASVSLDDTVKIWNICSDDHSNITTLKLNEHGLCVDYFTRDNRQHLIVGCQDKTPQIFELRMKERVHELEGHEDRITAVSLHSELQLLITGSLDGAVCIWNSTTYKLENIICFNLGTVHSLGCMKGSRRIVVGCHQGIGTMDISPP